MNIHFKSANTGYTVTISLPLWACWAALIVGAFIVGILIYKHFKKKNSN